MCCTLRMIPQWTSHCSNRSIHHFTSDAQQNNTLSAYLKSCTELRFFFPILTSNGEISLHCEESHAVRSLTFDQRCPASF